VSREQVADHLLVECAKWNGGLAGHAVAVSTGFDAAEHFAAQLAAFAAIGLVSPDEADDWRRRFADAGRPDPQLEVDTELRERTGRYLESLLRSPTEARSQALAEAVNVFGQLGILTRSEASGWLGRLYADDEDDSGPEEPDVRDRDLRRVILGPVEERDGFRVVSVEVYPGGLIVNWTAREFCDLALSDDVGTPYEERDMDASESSGELMRGETAFAPAVPETATRLSVEVAGQRVEMELGR
jgi:hypothetical protein